MSNVNDIYSVREPGLMKITCQVWFERGNSCECVCSLTRRKSATFSPMGWFLELRTTLGCGLALAVMTVS